ncbi:putative reverse transcriptase domain-containing protein [Tanacetum coccineum]
MEENIVNDNIQGDVRNVIVNNDRRGCTYKEFLACNPKEYDGKGGAMERLSLGGTYKSALGVERPLLLAGALSDEAIRNGSIKKSTKKRENVGEPIKDKIRKDDNKRTRTGNAFSTTINPVRRENTGAVPKCTTYNFHRPPGALCHTCFNCNLPGHFAKDCRVVSRNVNPINARNPTARACYECGSTDHIKATCPRLNPAQRPGGNHQNQVVVFNGGQGRGNNGIESYDLGFSYEIEIASGQLVEINKLSNYIAEIICHKKVVRVPLPGGKVLRVIRERPKEKMRHLRSAKTKEQKHEEIVVVRDYPKVFPDDLSKLPHNREIEFCIELVPRAIPVVKSPYRLAPSEMEELLGKLKELQDKGFI